MSVMGSDQFIEFASVVLQQLPRDLEATEAQAWITNRQALARVLRHALVPPRDLMAGATTSDTREPYPANGVIFELTLDGDAVDPADMPRRDGHGEGWRYDDARRLTGTHTRRFLLVSVGYCKTFDELVRRLAKHGGIPEGQWRESFKDHACPDGKGPIGIADASWGSPGGRALFPFVDSDGTSSFHWTSSDLNDCWRWLVEVTSK